ncbi:uncharacterized protein EAE98_007072 [Botrytis deweyae]|uniref:Zn(2)-C6 fungal-type domain-containing protein n=1 Tax=Botrytis deweyae TaxID=2478750 RepID=A0ABQ7IIA0_9HELO|nr:uncharacterized protein EAE98_007072 [Botrytis deweyae]KAF7924984.1 hypothetical protein EAE98_007072 [Botrytis deweyae]
MQQTSTSVPHMFWSASNSSTSTSNLTTRAMDSISPIQTPSTSNASSLSPNSDHVPEKQGERQLAVVPDHQKDRITVPSACVACRSKHLKCDGFSPCSRCSTNEYECVYVRSRRGFKGPRRNGAQNKTAASTSTQSNNSRACPLVRPGTSSTTINTTGNSVNIPSGLATPPDNRLQTLPFGPANPPSYVINRDQTVLDVNKPQYNGLDLRQKCIEAFYYHFWPAHPFLLPRDNLLRLLKEKKQLEHLEAAMRYVGSFFIDQAPTTALCLEAERAIYRPDCPKDAFKVQAMLILCIGLDGYTYQEKALEVLTDAQELALQLGMNKRDFASMHGNGWSSLEESWRRTWWEMFVVDGMIAGVHQKSFFPMKDIPAEVGLPCEESEYINGNIPPPHFLTDFDDEDFEHRDYSYSSFTYRISAIRNLGRLLTGKMINPHPDSSAVDRLDAYLVNFRLHLPDNKRQLVSGDGKLDEMLFQANMITEAATIVLHRELSELDSSITTPITSCAPHHPIMPGSNYNIHASKTITAAQSISKLITLPVPLIRHTHFFTCVVTLASVVHLSCWSVLYPTLNDDDLKQQLKLNTGALKTLWQVWPSAGRAFGQVKGVASEIWQRKKEVVERGWWGEAGEEGFIRNMQEEQGYLEELQLLDAPVHPGF